MDLGRGCSIKLPHISIFRDVDDRDGESTEDNSLLCVIDDHRPEDVFLGDILCWPNKE